MNGTVKTVGMLALVWCVACGFATQSLALPEGRAYEMVSPVYKGGYGINGIVAVAPDGERVAFASLGAFAGDPANNALTNDYLGYREGGAGWSTTPLMPPVVIAARSAVSDFSATLDAALYEVRLGPSYGRAGYEDSEQEFLLHPTAAPDTAPNAPDPAPNFEVAGEVLEDLDKTSFHIVYEGSSQDLSHILFEDGGLGNEQLLLEAADTESHTYDLATGRTGGERSLLLLGLNNKNRAINPSCRAQLGGGSRFNAVSADGSEVFFTTAVDGSCGVTQLFARLQGQKTIEVSRPRLPACREVPCTGAEEREPAQFRGASEDGSRAFFTSTQPLAPGGVDVSNNLYMATIGCPAGRTECAPAEREVTGLTQVSSDPHAEESATVLDVVAVAPDGSHVYFVARGDLLDPPEEGALASEGRALPHVGADNLYAYDSSTGATRFLADLCSGPQVSGEAADLQCPAGLAAGESSFVKNDTPLWITGEREAQLNVCGRPSAGECGGDRETGRFLVFSSYARLTAEDTDDGRDVYRYDTQTDTLERVSRGESSYDADGNGSALDGSPFDAVITGSGAMIVNVLYSQRNMDSRAVSEDGSRIVFTTDEPLSPHVSNGLANAYEWHEGRVSLISGGSAANPIDKVVTSSSGEDIFFTTTQGLVPQDTDGQEDVYDARLNGGFPPEATEDLPCSGDTCQGPQTNPVPLLVPGSIAQTLGENLPPPKRAKSAKKAKGKKAHRRKRAAKRRRRRSRTSSGERR